ncbi:TIGR04222 domain-containing membrane protein [Nocardia heshunensis]
MMVLRIVAAPAAADTWGISGPDFLGIYLAILLVAAAGGFAWRTYVLRWGNAARPSAESLWPLEIAMLADDRRPVLAGLAQLRAGELISSVGVPLREPDQAEQWSLDPISRALHTRLGEDPQGQTPALLVAVRPETDALRGDLEARGYLMDDSQKSALLVGALPLLAVIVLGVVRVIAGLLAHHPVAWLEGLVVVAGVLTWAIGREVRLTHRGRVAFAAARKANRHLRPANSPAFSAYGPESAALAVALYGGVLLVSLDPALARAAELLTGGAILADGWGGSISGGRISSCGGGGGGGCGGGGGGCGG